MVNHCFSYGLFSLMYFSLTPLDVCQECPAFFALSSSLSLSQNIVTHEKKSRFNNGPGELSRYSEPLHAGRSADRIPVGDEVLRTRPAWPWGLPSLLYNGYGSFQGVKRLGPGVDNPPSSSVEVKERVELYFYSPYGPSWPVLG